MLQSTPLLFNLLLLCGLFCLALSAAEAGCPFSGQPSPRTETTTVVPPPPPPDPALEQINRVFRSLYSVRKKQLLQTHRQHTDFSIRTQADELVLLDHRTGRPREAVSMVTRGYQNYKGVCHVALGVYVALEPLDLEHPTEPIDLPTEVIVHLKKFKELIPRAIAELPTMGFPDGQIYENQKYLLEATLAYTDILLTSFQFEPTLLRTFLLSISPVVEDNLFQAAKSQIDVVHHTVQRWRDEHFTPETWSRLKIVISSGHMARTRNILVQYFSRLLRTSPTNGERIVYSENPDAAYIEDLLATHIVDWGIGDAFFGRGDRMHEDALSEGTARYLDILFPSGASDDDDNDDE